jgi:serine phosphatase RsbU (regulator of sigma subunit)/Tfp pilus assembly protein PilF
MSALLAIYTFIIMQLPVAAGITTQDSLNVTLQSVNNLEKVKILNELYKANLNQNPQKALLFTEEALKLAEKLNFEKGIATSLNNIGVFYRKNGKYDIALSYYIKSLKIHEKINNKEGVAFSLSNIGTIHSLTGDYEKALKYFHRALSIFEELGSKQNQLMALNNIGNVYSEQNENDKALDIYHASLKVYNELGPEYRGFDPFNNIGNVYLSKGQPEKALDFFIQSLALEEKNHNEFGQANALFCIGNAYLTTGNKAEALQHLFYSLQKAKKVNDKNLLLKIYHKLSEVYLSKGELFLAYTYLVNHINIKDSLFNEESNRKIAEMEIAYAFEQKEKEIELLKKESEIKSLTIHKDRIIMAATFLTSILLASLASLIYLKNRQSNRAKKLLEERHKQIINRTREIVAQKKIIEDKNANITDSIKYAKKIQEAILNQETFSNYFPESFIYYKPKDIVSGDFYWFIRKDDYDLVVLSDCTGHGVAGAFMTVIGNALLNNIININNVTDPAQILVQLHEQLLATLKRQDVKFSNHGMDIAICKIDYPTQTISFAGAKRPLIYIQDNQLHEIKGNNISIGDSGDTTALPVDFTPHIIKYKKGDVFYLYSDGYPDQFGGDKNKKYMTRRFKELIFGLYKMPMAHQLQIIDEEITNWKGNHEQTDDMLVIGFKIQ